MTNPLLSPGARRSAAALVMLAAAPSTLGQARDPERFLMMDRSLQAGVVTVTSIDQQKIRIKDEQGQARELPLSEVAALAPSWWRPGTEGSEIAWNGPAVPDAPAAPGSGAGLLVLLDGRRLAGRLVPDASGDGVAWDHPRLGRSTFNLDDVRRMWLATPETGAAAGASREASDRVTMTNGDVVSGFVDSVGPVVKVESDNKKIELPIARVASIELTNPPKAPAGVRLWLQDGSVIGAAAFGASPGPGELRIIRDQAAKGAAPTALSINDVVGVVLDAPSVVPLASLPIESQRGVGDRRYAEPIARRWRGGVLTDAWASNLSASAGDEPMPPLDAPDLELPGPMTVEWALPPGARRLAGWAEVPAESRLWAEFTLVIECISSRATSEGARGGRGGPGTPLLTESMSGGRAVVEFNVEIPHPAPDRLRITLDPGARGPIQDRVVLRRALLLVEPSAR